MKIRTASAAKCAFEYDRSSLSQIVIKWNWNHREARRKEIRDIVMVSG
jgi:hypothetical protein